MPLSQCLQNELFQLYFQIQEKSNICGYFLIYKHKLLCCMFKKVPKMHVIKQITLLSRH